LIEAQEDNEAYYIIQEWCKGGALRDYVKASPKLYGENTAASIVRGTLRGMCHVHKANLIHRDIKGGNILLADVSADADIKLGDFGAAIDCNGCGPNDTVEAKNLVGTPWFVAPEGLSHKFGFKSDVWSLGVLTYQLLCGRMPFNDKEEPLNPRVTYIYRSIFTDEPKMTGQTWDTVSQEAKAFVTRCLHKDFKKRPTAEEALNDPWLTKTECADRFRGTSLVCTPFEYEHDSLMNARTIY
jgi:calcium-dependent protein kinase